MQVRRIFVEKRHEHAAEARFLLSDLKESLHLEGLRTVRVLNRYDVQGLDGAHFNNSLTTVFAEPMVDDWYVEDFPHQPTDRVFGVEYLPGQYDQRADSAEQCLKVTSRAENLIVRCGKVYVLGGEISNKEFEKVKTLLVNTVDQREASLKKPQTLQESFTPPSPVPVVTDFISMNKSELDIMRKDWGLAMSTEDLLFAQDYFKNREARDPSETEIRILDTYWSDHCRHTTFNTELTDIEIEAGPYQSTLESALESYMGMRHMIYGKDSRRVRCLMDMATIGARYAKRKGWLDNLEESEENNACSIVIDVSTSEGPEEWLLMFKNETHNHPTEIEPFGGAATCLGGAIRDPLSGRAFVCHAMRISGSADPRAPLAETLPGKLPQRKITKEAARGFSSYGNQIGLATGYVQEHYHPGYLAKRMEVGAVVGAAPRAHVRRETPAPGDVIILVGGRTGRDGIGGATGSSKEHDVASIDTCGAEVQKGNAPEEHKIQRLFRNPKVSRLIKKCNDFGAGGVSVAIGELAPGLSVDLHLVPRKYEGLTSTEIAISESQERMAVLLAPEDKDAFMAHCAKENLEATHVAVVTDEPRLTMRDKDDVVVDVAADFLDSAGAPRSQTVLIKSPAADSYFKPRNLKGTLRETVQEILSDLNVCSQKGLVEMFDSTVGAGSVLTPYGGKYANTLTEAMAAKIPVQGKETSTVSIMSSGFNPHLSEWSPFHGGLFAVVEAAARAVCTGAKLEDLRLSLQEYFERLGDDPARWGKPCSALLGALIAQKKLGLAAIGGKDSMSGTFRDENSGQELNVPPTLIAFAAAPANIVDVISPEFKDVDSPLFLLRAPLLSDCTPDLDEFKRNMQTLNLLISRGKVLAAHGVRQGGIAAALCKMGFGNMIGATLDDRLSLEDLTFPLYGSVIIEGFLNADLEGLPQIEHIGKTNNNASLGWKGEKIKLSELLPAWEEPLEKVFPTRAIPAARPRDKSRVEPQDWKERSQILPKTSVPAPRVAILALPGTNCEYDTKRAFELAGSASTDPFIFCNQSAFDAQKSCEDFARIVRNSQILVLPGGFSAGDEPEGSGKFFVSVFRNEHVREAVEDLIYNRDGLVLGICNGFQALVKTGLLPFGHIQNLDENAPTLSYNNLGRHISQVVRTRVASVKSPWLAMHEVGDIHMMAVSHGEGRFTAPSETLKKLFASGQVAFQYVDMEGEISLETPHNPNGSDYAIEGICSPDGRILGKMGHTERAGKGLLINNAYGNFDQKLFLGGVRYFR